MIKGRIHVSSTERPSRWERGIYAQTVTDDDYPGLQARFTYQKDGRLTAVTIAQTDGEAVLTMTTLRDLPMVTWQQAARATAAKVAIAAERGASRTTTGKGWDLTGISLDDLPHRNVLTPARLVRVADAYRANLAAGVRSPAAAIAKQYGVPASTVRSWLHRARKAGLLGPAFVGTAGERREGEDR